MIYNSPNTAHGRGTPVVSSVPAWLPAVNTRGNVSLNLLNSAFDTGNADSRLRGTRGVLNAWSGTTYAPTLGTYGSILAFGGGHSDGIGNSVYRYDIETRLWSRISNPTPVAAAGTNSSDVSDQAGNGDLFGDAGKTYVLPGKVSACHTYGNNNFVPPSVAGNTNGWLFLLPYGGWSHFLDLDNPSAGWARFIEGSIGACVYGYSVVDTSRSRLFSLGWNGGSSIGNLVLNLTTGATSAALPMSPNSYYCVGKYAASDDLYIVDRCDMLNSFVVIDPAANTSYFPSTTGTAPTVGPGTFEWVESDRTFTYWPGTGETLYYRRAPANPRTQNWAWESQLFTGDTPSAYESNPMYSRLHWVESLGSYFHVSVIDGPVQCWRVK